MGSGLGQLCDRFEIEIALLEAEAGGAIDPEFDGDFVTGPDPSGLALGDLPSTAAVLTAAVLNGEVVADRASEGLSEERVEIGPLREATVCVTGLSGLDREVFVPEREVDVVEVAVGVFERRDVLRPSAP